MKVQQMRYQLLALGCKGSDLTGCGAGYRGYTCNGHYGEIHIAHGGDMVCCIWDDTHKAVEFGSDQPERQGVRKSITAALAVASDVWTVWEWEVR